MEGWIKIHRRITEWEWYNDLHTRSLFIHLILTCNFKPTQWRGIQVEAGETLQSLTTLAEGAGMSLQNVRTALRNLQSTGELTERQHGKHRILKLKNYTTYQVANTETNTETTRNQHGSNTVPTRDKETQEVKKEKKETKPKPLPTAEAMRLAQLLLDCILHNNDQYRHTKQTTTTWAYDIEKLMRIDKFTYEQVEAIIKFAQSHDFWHKNILSGSKLRKQFNRLVAELKSKQRHNGDNVVLM